jgi:uncharacterized protein (UPF0333 family)
MDKEDAVNSAVRYLVPIVVIAMGMVGLYYKVDYSGWVLFFGLIGLFG